MFHRSFDLSYLKPENITRPSSERNRKSGYIFKRSFGGALLMYSFGCIRKIFPVYLPSLYSISMIDFPSGVIHLPAMSSGLFANVGYRKQKGMIEKVKHLLKVEEIK